MLFGTVEAVLKLSMMIQKTLLCVIHVFHGSILTVLPLRNVQKASNGFVVTVKSTNSLDLVNKSYF